MDAIEKRRQLRPSRIKTRAGSGRLDWKAHLNIRGGELIAREPEMRFELGFQISQVLRNLRLDLSKLGSSGLGTAMSDLNSATQEARAISREIGHAVDAVAEVKRL